MENLLFSFNATFPIFFLMVIGFFLRQRKMFSDHFLKEANTFTFQVTLPALLFQDLYQVNIYEVWDTGYVLFCAAATSICFFTLWFVSGLLVKKGKLPQSMKGAFVQASFRGSAAVLGIAFVQNIYGTTGMTPLMIIGTVPLYNIYSVIVLTFEANREEGEEADLSKIRQACINIVKNPIILGILAGLFSSLLRIDYPFIVDKTVSYLAQIASPLALIVMGAGFEGRKALANGRVTALSVGIKLLGQAAIFLPLAMLLGFRTEKLVALVVMLASPTTVSCYIMAQNMKNDGKLTASIVVATTFFSALTLTFWIWLLRTLGMV